MLEKRVKMCILYNLYGPLLTERQRVMMELYYYQDFSLGEIASDYGISRQAVYSSIRRAEETILDSEEQLQFEHRLTAIRDYLRELEQGIEPLLDDYNGEKENIATLFNQLKDLLE